MKAQKDQLNPGSDAEKDSRIFIPKEDGLGWTLNFQNKWSYLIIAIIIAFAISCVIYGLYFQK
jgi:uncharacterized membrane protein